jgi:Transglutaminase-like superfamily
VPTYFLSMHTHFCECSDGIIFLNVKTQRYQGLSKADAEHLRTVVSEWPANPNAAMQGCPDLESATRIAESLVGLGILSRHPLDSRPPIQVTNQAVESIQVLGLLGRPPRLDAGHVFNFLYSWAWTKVRLRTSSLATLTRDARRRYARLTEGAQIPSRETLHRLLTIFARLRPWFYTAHNKCLLDTLTLITFLSRYEVPANWVFGVVPKPFQAHCWAQCHRLVLNDSLEHMEYFTPILKI